MLTLSRAFFSKKKAGEFGASKKVLDIEKAS
jgi:hypothetical protein